MESVSGGVEDLEIEVEDGDSSDDETGIVGYFFAVFLLPTSSLTPFFCKLRQSEIKTCSIVHFAYKVCIYNFYNDSKERDNKEKVLPIRNMLQDHRI